MRPRVLMSCFGLGLALALIGSSVSAHHSYLLTVQQLRDGLAKATTPSHKGFFLIDVRSPHEHATGVIPGTDLNIDFREIKVRHREIGVKPDDHIVVSVAADDPAGIAAVVFDADARSLADPVLDPAAASHGLRGIDGN